MNEAESTVLEQAEARAREAEAAAAAAPDGSPPDHVDPDLEFIAALTEQAGGTFKKCFQCGTCSSTCELSPDVAPFPRKEMAWAAWGLRDRLLSDVDVWLCHQCNDCSMSCPRGGRPGDVLAAVRMVSIAEYSVPGFLARWVNRPAFVPLLLGIPAAILAIALLLRAPLMDVFGFGDGTGSPIVFSYTRMFPHWLLNITFGLFTLLSILAMAAGVTRLWRGLKAGLPEGTKPVKPVLASFLAAIRTIFVHRQFGKCTATRPRFTTHMLVFYGFLALTVVTLWVITSGINPLLDEDFIYPFAFLSPWKILANLGGAALVVGLTLMIYERLREDVEVVRSNYIDWALLVQLLLVVLTGFATEALHVARLEPHRHIAYFIHLVFALSVILYIPYSKLAHVVFRTVAMTFAEHTGRLLEEEKHGE